MDVPDEILTKIVTMAGPAMSLVCHKWRQIILYHREMTERNCVAEILRHATPVAEFVRRITSGEKSLPCRRVLRGLMQGDEMFFKHHEGEQKHNSLFRILMAASPYPPRLAAIFDVVIEYAAEHGFDKVVEDYDMPATEGLNPKLCLELLITMSEATSAVIPQPDYLTLNDILFEVILRSHSGPFEEYVKVLNKIKYDNIITNGRDNNAAARDVMLIMYAVLARVKPSSDSEIWSFVAAIYWQKTREWVTRRWQC